MKKIAAGIDISEHSFSYLCASFHTTSKRIIHARNKNLTHGSINRQLFNLAMPIMATSFIQMAYSLTDMAWVGRLGSEAVAAIGSVGILTWMSGSISLLNKVGSEVSVGQSIGAQNQEDARHFASHNITIALPYIHMLGSIVVYIGRPYYTYLRTRSAYYRQCRNLSPDSFHSDAFRFSFGGFHRYLQCCRTKQSSFLYQWDRINTEYRARSAFYFRIRTGN